MKMRFIKFHIPLLRPVLLSFATLVITIIAYGQDSEEVKGKVIARVVYSFPNALPGEKIEIKKVVNDSGKVIIVSSSDEYKTIDAINGLKRRENELVRQKYGVISRTLINKFETMTDSERIKVIIRFKSSVSEEQLQILNLNDNCEIVNENTVIDSVNKSLLSSLKFNSLISEIDKYTEPVPMSGGDENCEACPPHPDDPDQKPDIAGVYTGDAYSKSFFNFPEGIEFMPGMARGQGVNVATFEWGLTSTTRSEIEKQHPETEDNWGYIFPANAQDGHTQQCFHAMLHTAPKATLFHLFHTIERKITRSKLIEHDIDVASHSYEMSYGFDLEELTYMNSSIICIGTGNNGISYVPGGDNEPKWYNCIITGGCVYTNNSYYEISEENVYQYWETDGKWHFGTDRTQTMTMNSKTGNTCDKEVPHVVGPTRTTCTGGGGVYHKDNHPYHPEEVLHGFSGVSCALPSLVGICADIISYNEYARKDYMKHNTENVRLALLLTAENIDAGYWDPMVDGRDGCGVVSGFSAAYYANQVSKKVEDGDADILGLAYGLIPDDKDLGGERKKFNILTPRIFPEGKHLRAVLTWSCSIDRNDIRIRELSDLDLELVDVASGKVLGRCASLEDNIEVIDIPNHILETDKEYSLELLITSINFGTPTYPSSSLRYSIGWTWVNDFAGKTYEDETFTGITAIELLNRNIEVNNNTVFQNGSSTSIMASDRIVLNPGVEIQEGAGFTTNILKPLAKYNVTFKNFEVPDLSANLRDALLLSPDTTYPIVNRYYQDFYGAPNRFLDGSVSYKLDNDGIGGNPEYFDGLTLSMRIKFYDKRNFTPPNFNASGYIFTSLNSSGEGYYLKVNDIDVYDKEIEFRIIGGGNESYANFHLREKELEDWVKPTPPYNWGWVTVTAVWKAGEYIVLYANGEQKTYVIPTNVSYCPSNQCYIGTDPAINPRFSFTGGVGEVRLYSGADYLDHIAGVYHQNTFPDHQGSQLPFTLVVGPNGETTYEIKYVGDDEHILNFEDLEPLVTVDGKEPPENAVEFQVGHGFDIDMNFEPDDEYKVKEVEFILFNEDGDEIHRKSYPKKKSISINDYGHKGEIDNRTYHHCACNVTFEHDPL